MWADHVLRVRRAISGNVLGATVIAVFLGVAAGSTAAVYSLLDSFVMNPLPVKNPAQLVHVTGLVFRTPDGDAFPWWKRSPSLDRLAGYMSGVSETQSSEGWRSVRTAVVSGEFFDVFASTPELGRFFVPADEDDSPLGAAVISHSFWVAATTALWLTDGQRVSSVSILRRAGLDPLSWTSSERWIRCPEWPRKREAGDRAGGLMTTSKPRRSGWCWTRARRWARSPASWI